MWLFLEDKKKQRGEKEVDITRSLCYLNMYVNIICVTQYLGDGRSWISLRIGTL